MVPGTVPKTDLPAVPGTAALFALFAVAVTLRPQIIGVGPLVPRMQVELGMSHAVAGLLSSIPLLFMGLGALAVPRLSAAVGPRRLITWSVALLGAMSLVRAAVPSPGLILLATLGIGCAIGVAGATLPIVVKERFSRRPAVASGVYAAGMQSGSFVAAFTAIPLANALTSWRGTLAVFALLTILALLVWRLRSAHPSMVAPLPALRIPWRRLLPWVLAIIFALHTIPFYAINAWLPSYLIEVGWPEGTAGTALGVFNVSGFVASLTVPRAVDRVGSRRAYLVWGGLAAVVGLLALVVEPRLAWFTIPLIGGALGTLFVLTLTLPLDTSERPQIVAGVTAVMLAGGYSLSSTAPFVIGAIRDATAEFATAMGWLVPILVLLLLMSGMISSDRLGTYDR